MLEASWGLPSRANSLKYRNSTHFWAICPPFCRTCRRGVSLATHTFENFHFRITESTHSFLCLAASLPFPKLCQHGISSSGILYEHRRVAYWWLGVAPNIGILSVDETSCTLMKKLKLTRIAFLFAQSGCCHKSLRSWHDWAHTHARVILTTLSSLLLW